MGRRWEKGGGWGERKDREEGGEERWGEGMGRRVGGKEEGWEGGWGEGRRDGTQVTWTEYPHIPGVGTEETGGQWL